MNTEIGIVYFLRASIPEMLTILASYLFLVFFISTGLYCIWHEYLNFVPVLMRIMFSIVVVLLLLSILLIPFFKI